MNSKLPIIILVAVAFIAGGWLWQGERQPPSGDTVAGQRLFPRLEARLNDVSRITIERNGSDYDVVRKGGHWQLPGKGGYPVLFERVKPVLVGLSLLEKIEPKTSRPENYARLGVQEPGADTGNTRIQLYVEGEAPVASLVVGRIRRGLIAGGRDGLYVRIPGEPRAWLVAGNLQLPETQADWVDRQVMHIKPRQVRRVTIRHPDGDRLVVEKPRRGAANYTLVNLPAGGGLKDGAKLNVLARSLAGLKMEDLLVRSEAGFSEQQAVAAIFETWDGFQVTAYTVKRGEKIFAWFEVPDSPVAGSARTGWVYQIPRSRGDRLRTRLADVVDMPGDGRR